MIRRLLCAFALSILAWAAPTFADDKNPTTSLSFVRPSDECITTRELARAVEDRLGRTTFVSASQADLFVDVKVAKKRRGFHATVSASRANGQNVGVRDIATESASCRALDEDLVLVIALVIDPNATVPPPRSTPPPPAPIVVTVPVPVAPHWSFDARLAIGLSAGVLPTPVPAFEASLAAKPPGAWPIELGVIVSDDSRAMDGAHGVDVRLALGTIGVCPELFERGPFRTQLCAGAAFGALLVSTFGLDQPGRDAPLVDAFLRARAAIRLVGPLQAALDVGALFAFDAPRFYYTALDTTTLQVQTRELYLMPAVGFIASVGLGLHFR